MAIRLTSVLLLCLAAATSASADPSSPLSAIDWLSNSVTDEPSAQTVAPDETTASAPAAIRVLPLDAPVPDAAGTLDAIDAGLPDDLWGRSSARDLAGALARVSLSEDAPPSIARFLNVLLQTRLRPPIDAAVDDQFFFARVDTLLKKGHLDAAKALLEVAQQNDPQSFRRQFDIALLTGTETEACRTIETTPELSPTYPARIFCLARLGQFDVAALTLGNAETLGILSAEEDALLLHFLDPELFEGEPIPPAPKLPTPLQFRLYEAIGERIPTEGLPVPFAFADMTNDVGWKARLGAAERLAANGAIPFSRLLDVYQERGPSASGGVWERVRAITALSRAVAAQDATQLERALPGAWGAANQGGFAGALAEWLQPSLSRLPTDSTVAHLAFEIALFAEDAEAAQSFANTSVADRFLLSLAMGRVGSEPAGDALGRAVLRGLAAANAGDAFEALITDGRQGEALFRALAQLADGATGNPNTTSLSLAALKRIGLEELARQIAIELVLIEGAA